MQKKLENVEQAVKSLLENKQAEWREHDWETTVEDEICTLDSNDSLFALLFAIIVTFAGNSIDNHGKGIETNINNEIKIRDNGEWIYIRDFDTNTPFDIVKGNQHRARFGHDFNLFKKINSDYVMRNGMCLEELMEQNEEAYSLLEIMVKQYNLPKALPKRFMGIFKRLMVHYAKDLVTPDGLPLPFTSIFTELVKKPYNMCGYSLPNQFYKKVDYQLANIKASDINSVVLLEGLIKILPKTKDTEKLEKFRRKQIYMYASTFIIAFQLIGFNKCKRVNWPLLGGLADKYCSCINSVFKGHRQIISAYKEIDEVLHNLKGEVLKLHEYEPNQKEPYFFENEFNWYVSEDAVNNAYNKLYMDIKSDEKIQLDYLKAAEILKNDIANNKISIEQYREKLQALMKECYSENDISILDDTEVCRNFYNTINNYYRGIE